MPKSENVFSIALRLLRERLGGLFARVNFKLATLKICTAFAYFFIAMVIAWVPYRVSIASYNSSISPDGGFTVITESGLENGISVRRLHFGQGALTSFSLENTKLSKKDINTSQLNFPLVDVSGSSTSRKVSSKPSMYVKQNSKSDGLEPEISLPNDALYAKAVKIDQNQVEVALPRAFIPAHNSNETTEKRIAMQNSGEVHTTNQTKLIMKSRVIFSHLPEYNARIRTSELYVKEDKVDAEALSCLSEALYFEARGESLEGQFAVAEVILNRVDSERWPDDVCKVVSQGENRAFKCQFSYRCDLKPNIVDDRLAYKTAKEIARIMLMGAPRTVTGNSTHYHANRVNPRWAGFLEPVVTVGSHKFYRQRFLVSSPPEPKIFPIPSHIDINKANKAVLLRHNPNNLYDVTY